MARDLRYVALIIMAGVGLFYAIQLIEVCHLQCSTIEQPAVPEYYR